MRPGKLDAPGAKLSRNRDYSDEEGEKLETGIEGLKDQFEARFKDLGCVIRTTKKGTRQSVSPGGKSEPRRKAYALDASQAKSITTSVMPKTVWMPRRRV